MWRPEINLGCCSSGWLFTLKKKIKIYFIFMYECKYMHLVHVWCLQRPAERAGAGSPGTIFTDSCKRTGEHTEHWTQVVYKGQVLLTTKQSLQVSPCVFETESLTRTWDLQVSLGWLPRGPQGACLQPSVAEIPSTHYHIHPFTRALWLFRLNPNPHVPKAKPLPTDLSPG